MCICVCVCMCNPFCLEFSALSQSEILNLSLVLGIFQLLFLQKCPVPTPFSVCLPQVAKIFSYVSFQEVLQFYLLHFHLLFISNSLLCKVWERLWLTCSHVDSQFSWHDLLKTLSFPHWITLATLLINFLRKNLNMGLLGHTDLPVDLTPAPLSSAG